MRICLRVLAHLFERGLGGSEAGEKGDSDAALSHASHCGMRVSTSEIAT